MGAHVSRRGLRAWMAAALIGLSCMATAAYAQSVAGSYHAEGRNPDGSPYSGSVQIRDHEGNQVVQLQVGDQAYSGTGTRNGDVIWVNWGDRYPVVYVRMPSGELHGTWANGRALVRLIP
jgi:hypothetical protein